VQDAERGTAGAAGRLGTGVIAENVWVPAGYSADLPPMHKCRGGPARRTAY